MATKNTGQTVKPQDILSNKLSKVNDSFSVNIYDNGFMVEVSGRDSTDDWKSAKVVCTNIDELVAVIQHVSDMPRAE